MKKITALLLLALLISVSASSAIIKGIVVDSSDQPLQGVTTQLIEYPDSVRKGYMITTAEGGFSFKNVNPGNYTVNLTMVGMDAIRKIVEVRDTTTVVDLGKFEMTEEATLLDDAVVTAIKASVVAKQDTIEFNAGSFKTQANSNVEDLLKKLPGVEVSSDGTITSGGKTVSKILVDGKEFFGDDTKMATKNLPSDLVDKVQVVDRKSDLARITGVDDGEEETVINLTVKKDMKNGWFGTIEAGYGTDKRYEGKFNISSFTDNNQVSIVGGANNTNDLGFMDMGRGRFTSFGSNGGILTSQQLGVNFNVGKTEDFRVGGNVFYSHTDRHSTTEKNTEYRQPGRNEFKSESSIADDEGHNVRGNFRMQWKIDPDNTLDFRPQFSFNKRDSESWSESMLRQESFDGTPVNADKSRRFNHGVSYNADGRLIFNHNFASRPGRSFSVQADYSFSDTHQKATTWSDIMYYLVTNPDEDDDFLYRFIDNHQWNNNIGARLTWTEPLGDVKRGNFLQFAYRLSYRFNNANKDSYNLPEPEYTDEFNPEDYRTLPESAVFDADLSNRFRNKFSTQELQVGYKKVNKDYQLEAGMIFSPSSSGSTDLINTDRNIETRWVWNVAPFARFRYRFSKTKSIRADYRARTTSPSLTQLQPVADESNPLHVTIGNPDLKPTFTQSFNVNFNNYNQSTQQAIMAMIRLQYSQNVIVNRTVSDMETGKRTTTYANANGNFSANGMFMINQPLRNRKWRFNARGGVSYSSMAGYINGDFNRSGDLRIRPSAGMTFSSDIFQMSVNPTYSFSLATNSLPAQADMTTHAYGFRADANLYLPFGLQLNTDIDYSKTTGYSDGFNSSTWLWNAQISYSLLRNKSLTLSVRAYDLLGQNKNISRSVSANGTITDSRYNDLTRYVMFGISYTFNTLKNRKSNDHDREIDGPPMDPPPGARPHGRF